MLSKAFYKGVYQKALELEAALTKEDVFLRLMGNPEAMFGPHYKIVYDRWDALVKQEQTAPKKMRTFAETRKGKKNLDKKGKKGGQQATTADSSGKQPA